MNESRPMVLPVSTAFFTNANGSEVFVNGGAEPKPGDVITVTRKNGSEARRTVVRVLRSGGRGAWYVGVKP